MNHPLKFGFKVTVTAEAERDDRRPIENSVASRLRSYASKNAYESIELEHWKFEWIHADEHELSFSRGELKGIVKGDWELRCSAFEAPSNYYASYVQKLEALAKRVVEIDFTSVDQTTLVVLQQQALGLAGES